MVNKIKAHIWLLGLTVSLFLVSLTTFAQSEPLNTKVFDDAHILTAEEITEMEAYIQEIITYTEMDTIVVTSNDMQGMDSREYADEYYVNHKLGKGEGMSGVLILLNMEDREIYVYTRGYMREYLTDTRIDTILDDAYEYLSDDDYNMGIMAALDDITDFYEKGVPSNAASYDVKT
ncbi:MAG: TPM domain-containing protein, partial [Lachnospiraceae bacterium]